MQVRTQLQINQSPLLEVLNLQELELCTLPQPTSSISGEEKGRLKTLILFCKLLNTSKVHVLKTLLSSSVFVTAESHCVEISTTLCQDLKMPFSVNLVLMFWNCDYIHRYDCHNAVFKATTFCLSIFLRIVDCGFGGDQGSWCSLRKPELPFVALIYLLYAKM